MLELLHIENIAIIEAADIEFAPGFNALTGETGAGKSIVIDSLSAVLGQRTSRELIRTGAEKAFVSAAFSGMAPELTEELGIQPEADGTLLLQREIQTDGKNVCRVNGRPVTVGQLRALGARLLNIHGQHDGQQLLDEEQHIVYLDSFGRVESLAITYAEKYKHFTDIRRQIGALQMDEAEKARRVDTLQYQIEELRRAKLTPGEEEELTARRGMLRNAEKFLDAVAGADYALNGDDSGGGALSALRQAQDALGGVRHLDDAFGQLYERLGEAYSEVYDIAATVEDKRGELDVSPGELDRVESRMDLLYRLKKKYGATVEDMLDYQARCEAELAQIEDAGDTLARLEQARFTAAHSGAAEKTLINLGGNMWCLLPWVGTYTFLTMERFLKIKCADRLGLRNLDSARPFFIQFTMKADEATFFRVLAEEIRKPIDPMELVYPKELPLFDKYDEYLPEELVKKGFALGVLDVDGLREKVLRWEN